MNDVELTTDPTVAWSVWLQGSTQFWRAAPRGGSLTMQRAGLALSGEVELAMNWGVVDFSETASVMLGDLVAALRLRRLPAYLLFTSAVAPALKEVALQLGLEAAGQAPLMVRSASPAAAPSPALTVSHVHDEDELRLFARIAADAFEVAPAAVERAFDPLWLRLPDVDVFLGRDGERPVCGCVTTRTGGWTGIWAAATTPAERRRGYCTSLLSTVIERYRSTSDRFYLNATQLGEGIYRRLGFTVIDMADEWDVIVS
jgi:hypothetical protein